MTDEQAIVEYIKGNPGCVKKLWSPEDHDQIDETELYDETVWELTFEENYEGARHSSYVPEGIAQMEVSEQLQAIVTVEDGGRLTILLEA